ncbi:leucine-rich repeat neuronal protein 4-like [Stegostoma tigrinum]|uniref:leucine-rich repeat neuronal protein 4-like n=1 Tax=Stegostoma tigrinum TaxID=3053191 RepID=UPI0028702059|nr:leucine-rich repeat neuronal protein 4-like [Stegostoma tigrinum]
MAISALRLFLLTVMIMGQEGAPETGLTTRGKAQDAVRKSMAYIHFDIDEDYYEDYPEEEETSIKPGVGTRSFCDYDPCSMGQVPCSELQKATSCLCPGISSEREVPDEPRLRSVGQITESSAFVHWCEPASAVNSYRLVYQALGSAHSNQSSSGLLPAQARTFTLWGLASSTRYQVCVLALNQAGESGLDRGDGQSSYPPGSGPCIMFTTAVSSGQVLAVSLSLALAAAVLLGAGGFLLWRRARGRRGEVRLGPGADSGLQNPTFFQGEKPGELPL